MNKNVPEIYLWLYRANVADILVTNNIKVANIIISFFLLNINMEYYKCQTQYDNYYRSYIYKIIISYLQSSKLISIFIVQESKLLIRLFSLMHAQPIVLNMTALKPISLCDVIHKLATKVILNCLMTVLPVMISENLSAFTLGSLITNSILVTYEPFHYMHRHKVTFGAMS